jgi:hypothetical protein
MFMNLQVEHLFSNEYRTDLMRADQELRKALSLYETHGVQTWPLYNALALAQTLSGDFASAQASAQQVQMRNPQEQSARTAGEQLAAPPPQVAQAAAALRSNQRITPEQLVLIRNFAEAVAILVAPRFGKTGSAVIAGVELLKVFMPAPNP